jgi:hypothetical protein
MEGEIDMFKGRSMLMLHHVIDESAVCFITFAFFAIGNPSSTNNRMVITHYLH